MDTEIKTITETVSFAALPPLKQPLAGGTFCGVVTHNGRHCAVVLLDERPTKRLAWKKAVAWAKDAGGELPARPAAALLYAVAKDLLKPLWYWTSEQEDASCAWYCYFGNGAQHYAAKSYEGRAVAVRMIPLTA